MTRSRLAEILACIIERLLADHRSLADVDQWVGALENRGVAPAETRQVVGWLTSTLAKQRALIGGAGPGRQRRGVHVFDRNDQAALGLAAQGLLIELLELGLLDHIQVEEVVERALYRGAEPLGREEMRMIVAEVLMDASPDETAGASYWELFRGGEGAVH